MRSRNLYACLLLCLSVALLTTRGMAQIITNTAFSPGTVCAGDGITVTFSTTGTFGSGNVYTAQLSNSNGSFGSNPTAIGSTSSGNSINATIPKATVGSAKYLIRVVSSKVLSTSSTSSGFLTVNAPPVEPTTVAKSYCVGDVAKAADLVVNASPNATLNWYGTNATGGTASSTAPTPPTSTSGSMTYYVSQTVNGCEGPRADLVVTVRNVPAAPTAPTPVTYCEGATPVALSASGQALTWYGTDATGGTGLTVATVPTTTTAGTTNYYVSQTVNGCTSARTAIAVQVKDAPGAPTAVSSVSYCQNQTPVALTATASTGATLLWYGTAATGGTGSPTASTPATNQASTVNYYVSQTVNGCEGPRAALAVTVKPTPGTPSVVNPVSLCQNRTGRALTATPSAGGVLNWYGTNETGGTASPTAPVPPTSTTGTTTYYVSQSVGGCEGPRANTNAVVYAIPSQPTTTTLGPVCSGSAGQSLTASGQTLRWYGTDATGGTASPTPSIVNTTIVGSTNYYVTQTVNGCESERAAIPVRVKETPAAPGTAGVEFCQNYPAPVLTATLSASTTANWYGTNAVGGSASANPPQPTITTAGTTTYYVSQTLDNCESPRAGLNVRVKPTPAAPGVSPVSFCNNEKSQQLTANGNNGSTIKWYDANDNLLNGAPVPNTNTVGSQTFKATQTSAEGCESKEKASLVVTIKPLPGLPTVADVSYCQSQQDQPNQNISPLTANGDNLRWYNIDGNAFPNAPTPSTDRTGEQSYLVSQTVNGCEGSRAALRVTVRTSPAPTVARPLIAYCLNDKASPLEATGEVGGSLRWVDPYGRLTNQAPTPTTINTNVRPDGDPFYVFQIGANGCYSPRSTIKVIVNSPPSLALLAPTTTVNLGQKASLQLKFTGSGPYSYSLTGGYTGVSRTSDTTINVLPRGNTTYQVVAVTNGCGVGLPGNPATATVTVRVPTITTSNLTTSTLCAGTSLIVPFVTTGDFNPGNVFRIELANAADTTRKYDVLASAGESPVRGTLPTALPSGQYLVRIKASNPEIGITGSNSPTVLTVRSLPTASLAGSQTIYEGTPANLTLTLGGEGPWTVLYADSLRNYSTTATTNPFVVEARPVRTTTYRITSVTNVCGTGVISGTATVSVLPLLAVDDGSLDPLVNAYPVPTGSVVTIELDLPLTRDAATLSVTDLGGQKILHQTTRSRRTDLDLGSRPSGLYLLRIQVGDRQTVRKIVKQ